MTFLLKMFWNYMKQMFYPLGSSMFLKIMSLFQNLSKYTDLDLEYELVV